MEAVASGSGRWSLLQQSGILIELHQDHQLRKPVMVSPADLDRTEAGGAESKAYGPLQRPRLSVWSLPRARVLAAAPKDLDSVWIPTLDPRCRQEAVPLGRGLGGGCLKPCTLTVCLNFYQELRSVSADYISHLAGGGRERRSSRDRSWHLGKEGQVGAVPHHRYSQQGDHRRCANSRADKATEAED